jgi:hypothetical protein
MAEPILSRAGKPIQDLTGQTFSRLTVIGFAGFRGRLPHWLCKCDCGATVVVYRGHLKDGHTRSCGCVHVRHGAARKRRVWSEYDIWVNMKQRCENPRHNAWSYYGGRGIRVCEEWSQSFVAFMTAVGPRPSSKHSMDRIDVNRGYEPGNVRWATRNQQQRNRRDSKVIVHDGRILGAWDWAEVTGIPARRILGRLANGWGVADALTVPVGARNRWWRPGGRQ